MVVEGDEKISTTSNKESIRTLHVGKGDFYRRSGKGQNRKEAKSIASACFFSQADAIFFASFSVLTFSRSAVRSPLPTWTLKYFSFWNVEIFPSRSTSIAPVRIPEILQCDLIFVALGIHAGNQVGKAITFLFNPNIYSLITDISVSGILIPYHLHMFIVSGSRPFSMPRRIRRSG